MGIRSILSKPFAKYIINQQNQWAANPIPTQEKILANITQKAAHTAFGKDHRFKDVGNYQEFKEAVPVGDYEALRAYVDRVKTGEPDVLWPGLPAYFAKTSGTTSGTKYIPITKDSIPNHINSARNALLNYVYHSGNSQFLDGNLIFLSGSPIMTQTNGIHTGRLSGIVNHHVPGYLRSNQMPSYETNCIEDWEAKVDQIVQETYQENMTLISGIPPWVQMYFDRLTAKTGKAIKDLFPNFSLFVYGGVNFEPYKAKLFESIGKTIDSVETYPASEGFIAHQDTLDQEGLLLLLNSGIFFEFIPTDEYFDEQPTRLSIGEVKTGVNYALILNSNAGLWGYSIGDTVKFVSTSPYRLVVTGRIKHFISAFGEHVIGQEVEKAIKAAVLEQPETEITELTVAPQVTPDTGLPRHQWFVEFGQLPKDFERFANTIDQNLRKLNVYYDDLIVGNILQRLEIVPLRKDAFIQYMKSQGKLGGQNKVPRLSNDRKIADQLIRLKL
ncbi:GH3 auxin-responsive promoter family protein [Reichenbachiella carrageenanivorans]|uniref:GH3 auxin-responsive promoter family protein n=1 Tax=Reichenbachiella carrageenanivorans TaxID=2979869 RepID=A0ABY6CVM2_9BACT|nr:GH3 auxin-responsive promoter family protein [Reichenbachiella carrageenanivorans]UXX77957.1 GH3 auxin-responsive promoter family protein [Reichenbachiella carrageenanivorans]